MSRDRTRMCERGAEMIEIDTLMDRGAEMIEIDIMMDRGAEMIEIDTSSVVEN